MRPPSSVVMTIRNSTTTCPFSICSDITTPLPIKLAASRNFAFVATPSHSAPCPNLRARCPVNGKVKGMHGKASMHAATCTLTSLPRVRPLRAGTASRSKPTWHARSCLTLLERCRGSNLTPYTRRARSLSELLGLLIPLVRALSLRTVIEVTKASNELKRRLERLHRRRAGGLHLHTQIIQRRNGAHLELLERRAHCAVMNSINGSFASFGFGRETVCCMHRSTKARPAVWGSEDRAQNDGANSMRAKNYVDSMRARGEQKHGQRPRHSGVATRTPSAPRVQRVC
jgi:hypothetical protein